MCKNVLQAFVLLSILSSILLLAGCGGASTSVPAASATLSSPASGATDLAQPTAPLSVYIGSTDGMVSALNPGDGSVRWRYQATCACPVDVPALVNGVVYVNASLNGSGPGAGTFLNALNASDGSVRWQMTTPGTGKFSAVIKNVAYITSVAPTDDPTQHNELQARNASDGALLWRTAIAGTGGLAAAVADDTLYLASFDSNRYYVDEHRWTAFYALNITDGTVRWHRTLGTSDFILAVANGQLYAQEGLTDVVCSSNVSVLNASDGSDRWAFPTDTQDGRACTSWLGTEHNLVYGITTHETSSTVQCSLYALNAGDGSRSWQIDVPLGTGAGLLVNGLLANGMIYLPVHDALAAYSARDGSQRWRVRGESGPINLFNGVLYSSTGGKSLDALNPATSSLQWRYQTADVVSLSALATGMLYGVASYRVTSSVWHQDVVALKAGTGKLLWRFPIGTSEDAPLVG
jgi:outer membrane protein assembly factor BamB